MNSVFVVLAVSLASVFAGSLKSSPFVREGATLRISNGQDAVRGEAPFIVSIRNGSDHFCAGSIIHPQWILTAAHCLPGVGIEVVAGVHDRSDESRAQVRQVTSDQSLFVHPNYTIRFLRNDIGLIYLPEALVLSSENGASVAKISPSSGKHDDVKKVKLYGWGLNAAGIQPDVLQKQDLDIISNTECTAAMFDIKMPAGVVCTLTPGVSTGPCDTDSGGPLVRDTPEGVELVGVTSWAPLPCNTRTTPSVFTRVSEYRSWIENTMNKHRLETLSSWVL